MLNGKREEILSRLTIEDIYGVGFKKAGKEYKKLCPLHPEKTPSFSVDPNTLNFYCFGCHKGGDPFQFVMLSENKTFPEALEYLAQKAGIDITTTYSQNGEHQRLYRVNKDAMEFYESCLSKNLKALSCLRARGITEKSIKEFHVGFANGSLTQRLKSRGYTEEEIIKAGLGIKQNSKNSNLRDFFYNRIMFPIILEGKVIGFGGRTIKNQEPKYLNTPNTAIFQKRETLFGLNTSEIKKNGFTIIVEGFFDVITCHQHGYKNVVATFGTVLTERHIDLLRKHCDRVIVVFDGDRAGQFATEKTVKVLFDKEVDGSVIILPEKEDPDSFLKKGGNLAELIEKSLPFGVFLAKTFPQNRKILFRSLLKRDPIVVSEFLSYMGSPEEINMFSELNARSLMKAIQSTSYLVVRQKNIEVRRFKNLLVLFKEGNFLFWQKIKSNYRSEAMKMISDKVLQGILVAEEGYGVGAQRSGKSGRK